MAELTDEQKKAVVLGLANFMTPAQVRAMMLADYEVEMPIRQVVGYDPTRTGFDAGPRWREMFELARKAHIEETITVPIAGQGFRLRSLQEMHDKAKASGNYVLAAELLEQAAKEVGGLLTNARQLNVSDNRGGTMDLTPEERRAQAVELIREALAKQADLVAQEAGVTIDHKPQESVDK